MKIKTNFYIIEPYSSLLFVKSFSSWDDRTAVNFAKDAKSIVLQHYKCKAWAILHDGREWNLGTPESELILAGLVNTRLTDTITHHAFVTGQSEIKNWQLTKIFKDVTRYEAQIFEDIRKAEMWLASFGYYKTDFEK